MAQEQTDKRAQVHGHIYETHAGQTAVRAESYKANVFKFNMCATQDTIDLFLDYY